MPRSLEDWGSYFSYDRADVSNWMLVVQNFVDGLRLGKPQHIHEVRPTGCEIVIKLEWSGLGWSDRISIRAQTQSYMYPRDDKSAVWIESEHVAHESMTLSIDPDDFADNSRRLARIIKGADQTCRANPMTRLVKPLWPGSPNGPTYS